MDIFLIKLKYKYTFLKKNIKTNKITLIIKGNSKTKLIKEFNKKNINTDYEIMLIKLDIMKEWHPDKKIPVNMIGGPIKIKFEFFNITSKNKLKKKEDKRDIQIIYYTLDYYRKNNIKTKDLKKIGELAFSNKLEKRLLAPKLITQIT